MKKVCKLVFVSLFYFVISTFQCTLFSQSLDDKNQLNAVYHKMMNPSFLELGNLVFYFEHEPLMNLIHQDVVGHEVEQQTFFFPMAKVLNQDVHHLIKKIHNEASSLYTIELQEVQTPIKGIKLIIQYDPKKITLDYDFLDSFDFKKGVIFRFYNSQVLKKIQNIDKTMLQIS